MTLSYVVGLIIKLFLLLTPFFVLSVFIATCDGMETRARKTLAFRTGLAVIFACLVLYLFGEVIFDCLGISLNAFRIGAGLVLMLNGIDMVRSSLPKNRQVAEEGDPAVVPLAIPTTVGPGTIGTLLVMGSKVNGSTERFFDCIAIVLACVGVGLMLYFSHGVAKVLQKRGVKILSKLTGMYLVALAAQIMGDGICGFLK